MIKLFQKFARCGAELHGLKPAQPEKEKQRAGRIRPTGGSPVSGRGGTPRGGHPSPLFGSMGRQNLRFRTSLKTVGLRPTTRKFFEKNLTKNFSLSLPNLGAGIKASRPPQTPPPKSGVRDLSRAATRRDLSCGVTRHCAAREWIASCKIRHSCYNRANPKNLKQGCQRGRTLRQRGKREVICHAGDQD